MIRVAGNVCQSNLYSSRGSESNRVVKDCRKMSYVPIDVLEIAFSKLVHHRLRFPGKEWITFFSPSDRKALEML